MTSYENAADLLNNDGQWQQGTLAAQGSLLWRNGQLDELLHARDTL